jgi:hypothetical protein
LPILSSAHSGAIKVFIALAATDVQANTVGEKQGGIRITTATPHRLGKINKSCEDDRRLFGLERLVTIATMFTWLSPLMTRQSCCALGAAEAPNSKI